MHGSDFISLTAKHKKEKEALLAQFRNLESSSSKKSIKLQESHTATSKLRSQIQKSDHELTIARKALERLNEERKSWEAQMDASKAVIRKLENKIFQLVDGDELHQEYEKLRQCCEDVTLDRERLREDLEKSNEKRAAEEHEVAVLRHALDLGVQAASAQAKAGISTTAQHTTLLYDLAAARETIETVKLHLRHALLDQDRSQEDVLHLNKQLEQMATKYEEEKQLRLAAQEQRALASELERRHKEVMESNVEFEAEVTRLTRELNEVKARNEQLGEGHDHIVKAKEAAEEELSKERQEAGKRLESHFDRITELTKYGELLQAQLETERKSSAEEREKRRKMEDIASELEEKMALMNDRSKSWEAENNEYAQQAQEKGLLISELVSECSKRTAHEQMLEERLLASQDEKRLVEESLESERKLNRAAEKNIQALVEEKRLLVRDTEKAYRKVQEVMLVQPKLEEELSAKSRQVEHLKRNRTVVEDTLTTQLQHARESLDDQSSRRTELSDELISQQRENDKIRALLSMETRAKHRLL